MSHWAELDENNTVLRVIVGSNEDQDEGYTWIMNNLGGTWVQTSYNSTIRKQFAGIGFTYDPTADVFITPQPYASWSLDGDHDWQAPTSMPEGDWMWDEETLSWVEAPSI